MEVRLDSVPMRQLSSRANAGGPVVVCCLQIDVVCRRHSASAQVVTLEQLDEVGAVHARTA